MRLGGPEQIAFAASHIEPRGLPSIHSFAGREFEEHVDLSGEEKLRSGGEILAHRIVEQFFVFGREAIKFLIHTHSLRRVSTLRRVPILVTMMDSPQRW